MPVGVLVGYELGVKNRLMNLKDIAKAGVFVPGPTMDDSIVRADIRHSLINRCLLGL